MGKIRIIGKKSYREAKHTIKGFTFIETLVAVLIMGSLFLTFISLTSSSILASEKSLRTAAASVCAHNTIYADNRLEGECSIAGKKFSFKKNYTYIAGYRITSITVSDKAGKLIELLQAE